MSSGQKNLYSGVMSVSTHFKCSYTRRAPMLSSRTYMIRLERRKVLVNHFNWLDASPTPIVNERRAATSTTVPTACLLDYYYNYFKETMLVTFTAMTVSMLSVRFLSLFVLLPGLLFSASVTRASRPL